MKELDIAAAQLDAIGYAKLASRLDSISVHLAEEDDEERRESKKEIDKEEEKDDKVTGKEAIKFLESPDLDDLSPSMRNAAIAYNLTVLEAQRLSALLYRYAAEVRNKQQVDIMRKQLENIIASRVGLYEMLRKIPEKDKDTRIEFKKALRKSTEQYEDINTKLREDLSSYIGMQIEALKETIGQPQLTPEQEKMQSLASVLLLRNDPNLAAEVLVLAEEPASKDKMPTRIKRTKQKKKWMDCTKPVLQRGARSKKKMWFSTCRFKRQDGSLGSMKRIIGKDPKEKPREVFIHGKKMKIRKPTLDELESKAEEKDLDKDVDKKDTVEVKKKEKKPVEEPKKIKAPEEIPDKDVEDISKDDIAKDKREQDEKAAKPITSDEENWGRDQFLDKAKKDGSFDKYFFEQIDKKPPPAPDEITEQFLEDNKGAIETVARTKRQTELDNTVKDKYMDWVQKQPRLRKMYDMQTKAYQKNYNQKHGRAPSEEEIRENFLNLNSSSYRIFRNQRNGFWGKMRFKAQPLTNSIARHPGLTKVAFGAVGAAFKLKAGDPLGAVDAFQKGSNVAIAAGVGAAVLSDDPFRVVDQFDSISESAAWWGKMNVVPNDMKWLFFGSDAICNKEYYESNIAPIGTEAESVSNWLGKHGTLGSFIGMGSTPLTSDADFRY
jgi:hypothetical protein